MSELNRLIKELCHNGVEYIKIGNIATVSRGIRVVKEQLKTDGKFPVYQNSIKPLGYYKESNCKANTTFIIGAGSAGEIGFSPIEFWSADDCYYFICSEKITDKFLYYALNCQYDFIKSQVRKASVPRLARTVIEKIKIPVPPLDVQCEIVRILDEYSEKNDELIKSLYKEIELRKKQYEYYRDKLLNFEKKQ
ncbi:MAG: restriction endonuclease subunit S [Ruminococcus sp.]|nr:restriction endonuclease subunit S [Ruminococcus sp.]